MKLPLLIVSFLPSKWQERYIRHVWDNKTDADIIHAYENCTEWIMLSASRNCCKTTYRIAKSCALKLESIIDPQMKERGLIPTNQ